MTAPDEFASAKENAQAWLASIAIMVGKLHSDPDDESAREEIEQSALSVQVRDGWRAPGAPNDDGLEDYEILLSTGGPGLRIWGHLDPVPATQDGRVANPGLGTPVVSLPRATRTAARIRVMFFLRRVR